RRIAACAQRGRDVVEDLDLPLGVMSGHRRLLPGHDTERVFDVKDEARRARRSAVHCGLPDAPHRGHTRPMARLRPDKNEHGRSGAAVRRALGLAAFLPLASRAPSYARLIWALVRDERTPLARKAVLAG